MRDVVLRLLVIAAVAAVVLGARPLLKAWLKARMRQALTAAPLPGFATGRPLVLLFTGALCSDCIRQKDVLRGLDSAANQVAVEEVLAAKAPHLTRRFALQSVPATVILDGRGRPQAVNYGFVDAATLRRQLRAAAGAASA
ncbi:MAG TPA: thioredoxin family protein [Candidatus Limnocylindrales bacterium]|nr:thioredoxin family protein [Candidatus Limnocylindrales bacterium]